MLSVYLRNSLVRANISSSVISKFLPGASSLSYVTSVSSCRLTLLRAHTSDEDDVFPAAWARLARGGLDLRVVRNEGIRHDNIMGEPHVQVVASLLEDAIGTALDGADRRATAKTG